MAHMGYGMLLVAGPGVARQILRKRIEVSARRFARLLGARHLIEGVALALRPGARALRWAAATDLTHAASVVVLAWRLRAHRRSLALSGATALIFAGVALTSDSPRSTDPARALRPASEID